MDAATYDVFICSTTEDRGWNRRLRDALRSRGLRVADAVEDNRGVLEQPVLIESSRSMLVLWSRAATTSPFVTKEIESFDVIRRRTSSRPGSTRRLIFLDLGGRSIPPSYEQTDLVPEFAGVAMAGKTVEEVPDELWELAVTHLVSLLDPGSEPAHAEAAPGGNPISARARTRKPGTAPVPATVGDMLRVDAATTRYRLFPSVHQVVERVSSILGDVPTDFVSSTMLLAAISDMGQVSQLPVWAPGWLRSRWGDDGNRRLCELARQDAKHSIGSGSDPLFTADAVEMLDRASWIAQRTTGTDETHVRHVLGALLTDPRGPQLSPSLMALGALGVDLPPLLESYFDFVQKQGDDDDAWGDILLGARPEQQLFSGFDADAGSGDDQLDIRSDVMAFAGLIAARTVKPPLSIGLFGEWGSGKTFFMNCLAKQVGRLAREAREDLEHHGTRQRNQTFYRRIVQIEFNAWHYAEGNLWASLVQHIFDNLRVLDDSRRRVSEELQEPILEKLGAARAAEVEAIRERNAAEQHRQEADEALAAARKQFEDKARELADLSGANVLESVPTAAIQSAIAPTLQALGLDALVDRGVELRATLSDAKGMLNRGHAAIVPLMSGPDRARRWVHLVLALLAGPAAALAALWITVSLGHEGVASVAAAASGAAGLLAAGTGWLQRQLTWVGDHLNNVESAQREYERTIEAAQAANVRRVRAAEEQLRLFEADYVAAKRREEEARRRVVEAETKLREATVPRLLTAYIEERVNSSDYRKHLGVLALVRNDFERLSNLIREENEALDGATEDGKDPMPALEDELKDEKNRINRIVLYIDDLDRCPPAKVVEVLQAVHLLLAFPLFVVVVGVDARWVVRSLEARYRELLKTDRQDSPSTALSEFTALFGTASAHDYVEKIFQVPFWLKPMTEDGSRRMVRHLLKGTVKSDDAPARAAGGGSEGASRPADAGAQPPSQVPGTTAADPAQTGSIDGASQQTPKPDEAPRVAPDLSVESLEIGQAEMDAILDLAPLLGRSPRTLKRFVNVYRLIRVGLSPWERQLFLSDAPFGLPSYRAVLLLLAVDTGAPLLAATFLGTARALTAGIPSGKGNEVLAPTMSNLIRLLEERSTLKTAPEWVLVRRWLEDRLQSHALPDDVSRFARWIPYVSRFSFHTGRLEPGT